MVDSECRECVRVCTHRRWTAEGECVEHVHVCAPTGDGRPKVYECAVCAPTADGRLKVSECAECVHVRTHWRWMAEGV